MIIIKSYALPQSFIKFEKFRNSQVTTLPIGLRTINVRFRSWCAIHITAHHGKIPIPSIASIFFKFSAVGFITKSSFEVVRGLKTWSKLKNGKCVKIISNPKSIEQMKNRHYRQRLTNWWHPHHYYWWMYSDQYFRFLNHSLIFDFPTNYPCFPFLGCFW